MPGGKIRTTMFLALYTRLSRVEMPVVRNAVVLALLFLGVRAAMASAANPITTNFATTSYRVRDGLPEDIVQAFAQTSDGYLWIGTTGGLVRFDGARFAVLSNHGPAFHEISVHCLAASKDGSLWIGTEGSGLIQYRNGTFHAYTSNEGLSDMFVRAVFEDSSGHLWIGTNDGFFQLVRDRIKRLDGVGGLPVLAINAIQEDNRHRLWIGGSRLMVGDQGRFEERTLPGYHSRNRVKSILQTSDGAMWIGTVSGLYRSPDGTAPFQRIPGIQGTVRVLRQSKDGLLWMSVVGQQGAVYSVSSTTPFLAPVVPLPGTILSVFQDTEQNIWVGTQTGMVRYSRTPVSILPLPDARASDFGTLYLDADHTLWYAANHLVHVRDDIASQYHFPTLAGTKIRNLMRDRAGTLWLGTDGNGLYHLTGDHIEHFTTEQGLVNNFIRAIIQAHDGSLWIGTDEGVSRLRDNRFTNYGTSDGLAYFSIRSMLEDHNGDIWIGTDQGLSHFSRGQFVSDAAVNNLREEKVWAIHEDKDGGLWFGTRYHGLYRYKRGSLFHYGMTDGLASNGVYQILEDASGHFWMSGPGGISLLDRHELDAYAEHHRRALSLTFYTLPDDDGPVQLFGGVQPAGCITPQGDVWFPGNLGPVHVSLAQSQQQTMPRLKIDQVLADGRPMSQISEIALAPGNSSLEISYSPVMLRDQRNVRFRYKLEGLEKRWNDALLRRDISYINLPPGHYIFRVEGFETNAPNDVSSVSLMIVKRPYFYRTWWFTLLLAVTVAAVILAVYRARVARMRQRFLAVLEERNRIAREIHDTVIQGCTSVSAVLEAVSTISPAQAGLREDLLGRARAQVRATIEEARRAVWDLRQKAAPGGSLNTAMMGMAAQIFSEFGIPVYCNLQRRPFPASKAAMHEILMIVREALHNAALHGSPSAIHLLSILEQDTLTIEIADDGQGFSLKSLTGNGHKHYGVTGMRERAVRLGGSLEIASSAEAGTRVILRVPKSTAAIEENIAEHAGIL